MIEKNKQYISLRSGSFPLEDTAGTHASADAHAYNTETLLSALKFAHEGADHAAAGHTEGVAEGHGAALGVKLLSGNAELLYAVRGLRCESLVDFKDINIVHGEAAVVEGGRDGVSGANAHDLGRDTSDGEANNTAIDAGTETSSNISAGEEDAAGTIGDLTGVASGGGATLLECSL